MQPLSQHEVDYIAANAATKSLRQIARELGRGSKTVTKYAERLGHNIGRSAPNLFDQATCDFILANHTTMPVQQIADAVGRDRSAVVQWLRRRGLDIVRIVALPWTEQERDFLRCNWVAWTDAQLARHLGKSEDSVAYNRRALGFKRGAKLFSNSKAQATALTRGAMDRLDRAAEYLAAFDRTPVFRIDDKGQPSKRGKLWRYGTTRLTSEQMEAKAERKGFDADAWRRLAA